jgi:hypothetical protein
MRWFLQNVVSVKCAAGDGALAHRKAARGPIQRASWQLRPTSYSKQAVGGPVKKAFIVTRNIVGVAGLLLAGYVLVTSIPDVGRYIKISTM